MYVTKDKRSRASGIPTGIGAAHYFGIDYFEIGRVKVFVIVVDRRDIGLEKTRKMNSGTVQIGQGGL